MKKMEAYGEAMISMVGKPIPSVEEIDGIGFKTADKLAKAGVCGGSSPTASRRHIILYYGFMYGKRDTIQRWNECRNGSVRI